MVDLRAGSYKKKAESRGSRTSSSNLSTGTAESKTTNGSGSSSQTSKSSSSKSTTIKEPVVEQPQQTNSEWQFIKNNKDGTSTYRKIEYINGLKQTRVISDVPEGYMPNPKLTTKIPSIRRVSTPQVNILEQELIKGKSYSNQGLYITTQGVITTSKAEAERDAMRLRKINEQQKFTRSPQLQMPAAITPQGELKAAKSGSLKSEQRKETIRQFSEGFGDIFFLNPKAFKQSVEPSKDKRLGQLLGGTAFIGTFALPPFVAIRGLNVVSKTPIIGKLAQTFPKTTSFIFGGIEASADVAARQKAAKEFSVLTATPQQKNIMSDTKFQTAILEAASKEREALGGGKSLFGIAKESIAERKLPKGSDFSGIIGSTKYSISPRLSSKKDVYYQNIEKSLKKAGYSESKIKDALAIAEVQRTYVTGADISSQFAVSAVSERTGRNILATTFEKNQNKVLKFSERFLKSAASIAPAGFIEGGALTASQQKAGQQPLNIKEIFAGGGIGTITAGTLGGLIGGLATSPKISARGAGKVVEYSTYLADLTEKPADIIASIQLKGAKKFLNIPIITPTASPTKGGAFVGIQTETPTTKKKRPKSLFPSTSFPVQTSIITQEPDLSPKFVPIFEPEPKPTPSPTKPGKPKQPVNTFDEIIADIETPTPPQTPSETPVKTPINPLTNIFTPVPVVIGRPYFPPPLPLNLGFGGGRGGKGGKGNIFINELAVSQKIFKDSFGSNILVQPKPKQQKKGKKGKKKGKTEAFSFDDFFKPQPIRFPKII